jgi:HEAT repeat protein
MQRICAILLVLGAAALAAGPGRASDKFLGKTAAEWQKDLGSDKAPVRASAAFALGKIGPDANAALPALTAALRQDKDASVRDAAALAVGRIVKRGQAPADLVNALCDLLAKDADVKVKRSAAVALGQCASDTPQVRGALEKAAADPSKGLKQNAAWALGELCEKAKNPPVAALRTALGDSDKLVKRDAAIALGKLEDHDAARKAVPDLVACVNHEYIELQKAACFALVELVEPGDKKTAEILAKICKDKDKDLEVRQNAALALSNIGGPEARAGAEVLLEVLQKGDLDLKRRAALAFRNTGEAGKIAQDDLIALLKHRDDELRYNSTVALGGLKSGKAVPALVERMADMQEKENVRIASAVSLFDIGKCPEAAAAVPKLIEILQNPKQPAVVRWRLLWALRVHQGDLLKYDQLFTTMKNVLGEQGLQEQMSSSGHASGKMLRYDCAFLLSVLKQKAAPDEVVPVLKDFLYDDHIRIYTGVKTGTGGAKVEGGGGGGGSVNEQGDQDGRIMAIKAIQQLGHDRVKGNAAILDQLRKMTMPPFEPEIREAAQAVLTAWGENKK